MTILNPKEVIRRMREARTRRLREEFAVDGLRDIAKQQRSQKEILQTLELPFSTDTEHLLEACALEWTSGQDLKNHRQTENDLPFDVFVTCWVDDPITRFGRRMASQASRRRWAVNLLEKYNLLSYQFFNAGTGETASLSLQDFFSWFRPDRIVDSISKLPDKSPHTVRALISLFVTLINDVGTRLHGPNFRYKSKPTETRFLRRPRYSWHLRDLAQLIDHLELKAIKDISRDQGALQDLMMVRLLQYAALADDTANIGEVMAMQFKEGSIWLGSQPIDTPKVFTELVRAYRGSSRRQHILANALGKPLTRDRINRSLSRAMREVSSGQKITPESIVPCLRHSLSQEMGVSPKNWKNLPKR
jgi:hypothetical protein